MLHKPKREILMKYQLRIAALCILFAVGFWNCGQNSNKPLTLNPSVHDLVFNDLATTWDEGMPIGNGLIGGLVWQKDDRLRISLDRSDLWDNRASKAFADADLNYQWLYNHRINGTYDEALEKLTTFRPGRYAPTKIPGGALEFDIASLGDPTQVRLYLKNALCSVKWENQAEMQIFTHAVHPVGWFRITSAVNDIIPVLKTPEYQSEREANEDRVGGQGYDILYLDYEQGEVISGENRTSYHQKGSGDFYYDIATVEKV
jgi:alpha-L-fucosidase 2